MLKRQRADLLRLQLQKQRLTALVIHDLKTPVGAMDLHAQLLLRMKGVPPLVHESAAAIRHDARRLSRLILNLLDSSKAEEGRLIPKCSSVDLPRLVADLLSEFEVIAQSRGIRLRSAIEVERVHIDEDLFRRTLINLVENAIRYAPPKTWVTVTAAPRADGTELRVADAGRGIATDMREKVFEAFVQTGPSEQCAATSDCRGLGLTFCKLAIEAHGGRIWVEDAVPGAVFCLSLPHGP